MSTRNRMVNLWNAYQCMVEFNMCRSASLFESGIGRGMGFRDSNQDLLGFVHMIPERARERILDLACTQLPSGGAYHQYQPLTKRGNDAIGSGFNDDPLWLVLGVAAYLKETGDPSILDEPVRVRRRARAPKTPLYEHLQRALRYTLDRLGPARAAADRAGRLERLPQPQLLLRDAGRVVPDHREPVGRRRRVGVHRRPVRPRRRGDGRASPDMCDQPDDAEPLPCSPAERMAASVAEHGWDGEWFLRAYDYYGDARRLRAERRGPHLHRAAGHVRAGRRRPRRRAAPAAPWPAFASTSPPTHGVVLLQPALHQLPDRARRDLLVPARLQGERRASSATRTRGS